MCVCVCVCVSAHVQVCVCVCKVLNPPGLPPVFFCYFSNQQAVVLTAIKLSKHRLLKHFYIPKAVNNCLYEYFEPFNKGQRTPTPLN